ncbi:MAG: hypothetical protein KAI67_04790 [Candidatus Pacebacteria bacterium]|nr:hypothetical protein [Candidatus Paceibacterota bacterium]
MSKKTLFHYAAPAIITGMLFATVAVSWEEPGSNPPAGNVPAPINVSASNQSKEGWLTVGSTSAPSMQLDVQGIAPALGSLNVTGGAVLNTGGAATGLIVANGNVGIGTTDPKEKLHVAGDAVRITDSSAEIQFDQTNVSPNGDWLFKTFGNGLRIRVGDADTDSWSEKVTILNNGNVGIGTDNPTDKLHIRAEDLGVDWTSGDGGELLADVKIESIDATLNLIAKDESISESAIKMTEVDAIGNYKNIWAVGRLASNVGGDFYVGYTEQGDGQHYYDDNSQKVTIKTNGNVGIGTSDPKQKLEVDGGIRLNTADARPACNLDARGTFWFIRGAAGVKDSVAVCAKDVAGAYAWRSIW